MHLIAVLAALAANAPTLSGDSYSISWEVPELVTLRGPGDAVVGLSADGCGFCGCNGDVLLPELNMYLPVPPGSSPVLSVEPSGIAPAGIESVSRALPSNGGTVFEAAPLSDLPDAWGELAGVTSFRGFSLARVRIHPVISSGGGLVRARSLAVVLEFGRTGSPSRVAGAEGDLLRLITGTDTAWRSEARSGMRGSPFAGLPWARIGVDTAGIHAVTGDMVPHACGSPSATLSLFTGRGRMMGSSPWDSLYIPRPVPVLVRDGGDGVFDESDSLYFFARGLSWWEPDGDSLPGHFMHQYSGRNFYWLTWGGEPGIPMQTINAGLTGAPAVQRPCLARLHFERDIIRKPDLVPGDWIWDAALGTGTQWYYHEFDIPGACDGSGIVRVYLVSASAGGHATRVLVNGQTVADTVWSGVGAFVLEARTSSLRPGVNKLDIAIDHGSASDDIYIDWFEVFPRMKPALWSSGQTHVPMEWRQEAGRVRLDWDGGLGGAMVFAVGGDTHAALLDGWSGGSLEVEFPSGWASKELWAVPVGAVMAPASVEYAEPGGLVTFQGGADRLYIYPEGFEGAALSLFEPGSSSEAVCLTDIYDEFNGGVRDPWAITAFLDFVLKAWEPAPVDVILCGGGHFDPRNRAGSRVSLIDPVRSPGDYFQDDLYTITKGTDVPQFAVSRISTSDLAAFAIVASRSAAYRSGAFAGAWQTRVLGAADDERSSQYSADETYHTNSMERILEEHLPDAARPVKHYMILYPFDSLFKKPEARQAFIDLWSEGALLVLFLGHGSFDQLADEGLFYLDDTGQLANSGRLPAAFFGSCRVGRFQDPGRDCIAQSVTTAPRGGAIVGIGATFDTIGPVNELLMAAFADAVFSQSGASLASCLLAAKLQAGYSGLNNRVYVMFGDGSTMPAVPGHMHPVDADTLFTGERSGFSGTAPHEGTVLLEAFESSRRRTYYTFRQNLPIEYFDMPALFFAGSAAADPGFAAEAFVPVDADTGTRSRIQALVISPEGVSASAAWPHPLVPGMPSASDSTGPSIEIWLEGFRSTEEPSVSGCATLSARLSDESGINLVGNPGRQLALYVDGTASDVSGSFCYDPGSTTDGGLEVDLGLLPVGTHTLELAASDCLLNRSSAAMRFTVVAADSPSFSQVFAYPCPASDGVSINWTQSGSDPVDLDIYTISGRRVESVRNLRCRPGYNQYWWNCEDRDGDPVASGSYIFRISAGDSEACGIIALIR